MTGVRSKLYPLGNMNRSLEGLVYTIDTTKYSSSYATGYAPFTTGTYSSLVGETITIDWGDNSTSTITDGVISTTTNTHTYSSPGTYQIKITSTSDFPAINFYRGFGSSYVRLLTNVDSVLPYCVDTSGNAVTSFGSCFNGCSSLTTIPTDLFKYNTAVTSFNSCFYNCSSLTSIPVDLFKYNTAVTDFGYCFSGCSLLTSIPADLFKYNTAVTTFTFCFNYCSSLTSIPADLFKYNTAVTNFSYCFEGCYSSLTSIPADLFKYNTAVTDFGYCFSGCSLLTSIPAGLFRYNTAVTNFIACFYSCNKLQLNSNIFCDESTEMATRFASVTPRFNGCFSIALFSGTQGTAPQLWNYTYSGTPTSTSCFSGHSATSLTNYSSIPSAWGGSA